MNTTTTKQIAIAHGDGIGQEVINEAVKVLTVISENSDYHLNLVETPVGGEIYKKYGTNLPEKSFQTIKKSDAILFGAIGLPDLPQGVAESAILKLRQGLELFVNLRPVKLFKPLEDICPLKPEFFPSGIDISIIRENTESIYAQIGGTINHETAINNMVYTRKAVERIIEYAFQFAQRKNHQEIISVDKANVLSCSQFWREIFTEKGKDFPNLKKTNFYVDAFCQWLIRSPSTIQTVVTENMFGDIISDEAAYLSGSLGMAASGNINPSGTSMYEPIHGSAPDIAGKNIANPIGAILSCKLMFEESFQDSNIGSMIETAVETTIQKFRTIDIFPRKLELQHNLKQVSCSEMGNLVADTLKNIMKK